MSSIVVSGDTSGAVTLAVPAVAGTNTVTIPAQTGTMMVNGPTFRAVNNATQSITVNTFTLTSLQTKSWDTATAFNNTGSTVTLNGISAPAYAFAPNVAGYYQVNCTINAGTGSTGQIRILASLYKNGSVYDYGMNVSGSAAYGTTSTYLIYMNGTSDYIQLYAYVQASVAVLDNALCSFSAALVRGA